MPAKKTTATAKTTTKTATPKKEPAVEVEIEKSEPIIEKKQFKDDDKIQCMSITAGNRKRRSGSSKKPDMTCSTATTEPMMPGTGHIHRSMRRST